MTPDTTSQLKQNLERIRSRMDDAAVRSGRNESDVQLIAVSKYVDASVARSLVDAGCSRLGESRPQELWNKGEKLQDLDVEWHLIGHLQRNKIRTSLLFAQYIHSVDSVRLASAIQQIASESNQTVHCLLEINISGESAKHGFRPDEIAEALDQIADMPNLQLIGVMGMGGLGGSLDANRMEFRQLRELRDRNRNHVAHNIELAELSMGMSNDFEVAIEEGATMVRIGSSLFEGVI